MYDCFADKLADVQDCVSEIELWMECNMLKLDDDKLEFAIYRPKRNGSYILLDSTLKSYCLYIVGRGVG